MTLYRRMSEKISPVCKNNLNADSWTEMPEEVRPIPSGLPSTSGSGFRGRQHNAWIPSCFAQEWKKPELLQSQRKQRVLQVWDEYSLGNVILALGSVALWVFQWDLRSSSGGGSGSSSGSSGGGSSLRSHCLLSPAALLDGGAQSLPSPVPRSLFLPARTHMALLRKINQVLLFLLIVTLCGILYKKVHKGTVLKNEADDDSETPEELEDEIPVVICAAAGRMGAAMAAINSIYSNTDANILFYVVGLRNTLSRIRKWIEHSKLREINFRVVEFNPMVLKGKIRPDSSRPELLQPLNFVRFYLPLLIHQHEKVIYLDDDVIVQGDIQELYDTTLALGHAAAFSDDCDLPSFQDVNKIVGLQNTYMGYLDYRKKTIKDLGISPSTCSFNPGVIVANMTEWKHQRITRQLEKWMQKNVEENLYSSSLGGGVATSPMLIVFHGKHSTINPLWHIRHLGWNPDTRYSEHFLQEAKLLHWNGRHKPWDFSSAHNDLWESWFVPDPAGIFKLHHHDS